MKGIEQGCCKGRSCQGPKVVFPGPLTVPPLVLAHPPSHMTRMKQCPRPPGRVPPKWKERDWWSADLEGEMEKLEVDGGFSATTGGSVDPARLVSSDKDHKRRK